MTPDPILERDVSELVPSQLPDFYREDSPLLVEFLQQYYAWMESSGQALYHSRRLPDYHDVDLIPDDLIVHLKQKYLNGIRLQTETNVRQLIKHSLDIYRTKGTQRSIDLLFRLVFGTGASVYYPSADVFRLSDGDWKESTYLEVFGEGEPLSSFLSYQIVGVFSGATAFVERVVRKKLPNKYVDVVYLSSVRGSFLAGEKINRQSSPLDVQACPVVLGSLTSVDVTDGGSDYSVGDIVSIASSHGWGGKGRVAAVSIETGVVEATLVDGGYGYTANAQVLISNVVLSLSQLPASVNTGSVGYFRMFDSVTQPMADVTYDAATGAFKPGDFVYTYDANSDVTGSAVVMSATDLGSGNGIFRINLLSGNLAGGPFYTTGNAVSASQVTYVPDVSTANVIGTASVTVFFSLDASGYSVGEQVYQAGAGSATLTSIDGASISVDDLRGRFIPGVPLVGRKSGFSRAVSSVSMRAGVVVSNGQFTPGEYSYVTTASGEVALLDSVSLGSGFSAVLSTLDYTETQDADDILISGYANVALADEYGFPSDPTANASTVIADSLEYVATTYGEAQSLIVTSGGTGYNVPPIVRIYEPSTYSKDDLWWSLLLSDVSGAFAVGEIVNQANSGARGKVMSIDASRGEYVVKRMSISVDMIANSVLTGVTSGASGTVSVVSLVSASDMDEQRMGSDALVTTKSVIANGVVTTLDVIDSGLGYAAGDAASFSPLSGDAAQGKAVLSATSQGVGEGYYRSKGGFLSDSKKLFDGDYYQDFSYEIGSPVALAKYESMVKQVTHPAGTKMFGALLTDGSVVIEIAGSTDVALSSVTDSYFSSQDETSQFVDETGDSVFIQETL